MMVMFFTIAISNAVNAGQSSIPVSDGFDFPVGIPNGDGYNHVYGWDFLDYTTEKVYHPGEDWNGNGGGNSDLGDPVYAVSNGQIIAAGNYGKGWGNIILIQHLLPDGTSVWSQYAHLDKIMVSSGNVVRGQQIGTIGKGYNNEYLAHLHFEIRKENRSPNAWVSGWTKSKVKNYYYDPSDFINSHRQLDEPISHEDLIPLAGDMYKNGKDITGTFNSNTNEFTFNGKTVTFGIKGDLPVIGDWNGDGYDEIGVYRPDQDGKSYFYLVTKHWSSLSTKVGSADKTIPFGSYPKDIPIVGDWDGNGKDDVGGFLSENAKFYLYTLDLDGSKAKSYKDFSFGNPGDIPLSGDWDGNGKDEIGIFRYPYPDNSNTNAFYFVFDLNNLNGVEPVEYGNKEDYPVIGDWDGDNDDNIGVYRPATKEFMKDDSIPKMPYNPEPPVSDFSATPTKGNTPLKVTFTDKSAGEPTSWKWNFGDGETSTSKSPVHTYSEAGSYTVTLTVSNEAGESEEAKSNYITVTEPVQKPVAAFSASPTSGKTPLKVKFTDTSTGFPTSWFWNFGDGSKSYLQNPIHKYSKAGVYSVSLTVKNAKGRNTVTKTDYIKVVTKPVAVFSAFPTSGKAPLKITFTDKSTGIPAKWIWDFGDGSKAFSQNPTHKYSKAGVYSVSLTVKNAKGRNTVTKTDYIKVVTKPVAKFSAKPTSGKVPLKVQFTDTSTGIPTKWKWDFGDRSKAFSQNPTHKYSKAGIYTVSLTVKNAAGTNTKTIKNYITVKAAESNP
ncbi:M23 family metallopeptidase [Methanosarcina barkeri]|nr:PKD domain-containing protein [Methanosarcina barkeri]